MQRERVLDKLLLFCKFSIFSISTKAIRSERQISTACTTHFLIHSSAIPVASDTVIQRCNERQGRPRRDRKRPHCPEAGAPIGGCAAAAGSQLKLWYGFLNNQGDRYRSTIVLLFLYHPSRHPPVHRLDRSAVVRRGYCNYRRSILKPSHQRWPDSPPQAIPTPANPRPAVQDRYKAAVHAKPAAWVRLSFREETLLTQAVTPTFS